MKINFKAIDIPMITIVSLVLIFVVGILVLERDSANQQRKIRDARPEGFRDDSYACIDGIIYHTRQKAMSPAFKKDTIPTLILCD